MKIVAHRGASDQAADNSKEAIERAILQKANVIEFDIRPTRDNQLVLHHDIFLKKSFQRKRIKGLNRNELPDLLDLNKALKLIHKLSSKTEIFVDCKGSGWSESLTKELAKIPFKDQIYVLSFNLLELTKFKANNPQFKTIYLWRNKSIKQTIHAAQQLKHHGVGIPHFRLTKKASRNVKKAGLSFYVYGINSRSKYNKARAIKVDFAGTDRLRIVTKP